MRAAAALIGLLAAVPASAAEKYLPYPDMASCLERSRQQCVAQGCDGKTTVYWWRCDDDGKGGAVLVIEPDRADFDVTRKGSGLTPTEQSKLTATSPAPAPDPAIEPEK